MKNLLRAIFTMALLVLATPLFIIKERQPNDSANNLASETFKLLEMKENRRYPRQQVVEDLKTLESGLLQLMDTTKSQTMAPVFSPTESLHEPLNIIATEAYNESSFEPHASVPGGAFGNMSVPVIPIEDSSVVHVGEHRRTETKEFEQLMNFIFDTMWNSV